MKSSSPDIADELPAFVDLEAAARMAGVTRRTVQNKLATGVIPAKAVRMNGRQKLVAIATLEAVFGSLRPSSQGGELHGTVHGSFHESPSEAVELRAKLAAKEAIIDSLQATLDHERQDRASEREAWRKTLERTQANLLAAQDTPTARAIAGAAPVLAAAKPVAIKRKARREAKPVLRQWWRSLLTR